MSESAVVVYTVSVNAAVSNVNNFELIGSFTCKLAVLEPLVSELCGGRSYGNANNLGLAVVNLIDISGGICLAVVEHSSKNGVVCGHLGKSVELLINPTDEIGISVICEELNVCAYGKEAGADNLTVYYVVDTVDILNLNAEISAYGNTVFLDLLGNESKSKEYVHVVNAEAVCQSVKSLLNILVRKSMSALVSEGALGVGDLIVLILVIDNVDEGCIHILFGKNACNLICKANAVLKSLIEVLLVSLNNVDDLIVIILAKINELSNEVSGENTVEVNALKKSYEIVEGKVLDKSVNVVAVCEECAEDLGLKLIIDLVRVSNLEYRLCKNVRNGHIEYDLTVNVIK